MLTAVTAPISTSAAPNVNNYGTDMKSRRSITTSAPGKLILFGEHAVVHGKVAVAAALGLRTAVNIDEIVNNKTGTKDDSLIDKREALENSESAGVVAGEIRFTTKDVQDLDVKWSIQSVKDLSLLIDGSLEACGKPLTADIDHITRFVNKTVGRESICPTALVAAVVFLYLYICTGTARADANIPNTTEEANSTEPRNSELQTNSLASGGAEAERSDTVCRKMRSMHAHVKSQLPIGAGLGSSAAFSVALAAAMLVSGEQIRDLDKQTLECGNNTHTENNNSTKLARRNYQTNNTIDEWTKEEKETINLWAYAAECIIHGLPSGIDNTVSCYGSAIRFQKGAPMQNVDMPKLKIYLTNTMVPRSTKLLVAEVRRRRDLLPVVVDPILTAVENISLKALDILQSLLGVNTQEIIAQRMSELECLVDLNQGLLQSVGVGHPSISNVVEITRQLGFHTKLTGAGGGGCTMTLIPEGIGGDAIAQMNSALRAEGYEVWQTTVGGSGVVQHTSVPEWLYSV